LSRLKNFQEKLKKKSKYEIIKSLFQAVTATVVSVVAVTVLIPKSPIANFEEIKVFSHEIIYELNVTDEELTVKDDTLTLILENQYFSVSKPITIGYNYGSFDNLEKNTKYNLKVIYNKGFGDEVLALETFVTDNALTATISDIDYQQAEIDALTTIDLSLLYGDITEYTDLVFKYAIDYGYSEEELYYETISLIDLPEFINLEFYYQHSYVEYVFIIEGIKNSETLTLDEIRYKPPYNFQADVYLEYFNDSEAAFYIYGDSSLNQEVDYVVELYRGMNLVNTYEYIMPKSEELNQESQAFIIDNLNPSTIYHFVFKASYINPSTLRKEELIIDEIEVTTLEEIEYEYNIVENEDSYDVEVILYKGDFDYVTYEYYYYDEIYGYYSYYSANSYDFINEDGYSSISFNILKGDHSDFFIEIIMMNHSDYNFRKIIERIES
jgi:hypothetical protein